MIHLAASILAFCFLTGSAFAALWVALSILNIIIQAPFRFVIWLWKTRND